MNLTECINIKLFKPVAVFVYILANGKYYCNYLDAVHIDLHPYEVVVQTESVGEAESPLAEYFLTRR